MPIEHINKTDTLNEGRVKLNAAIDGANAADVTSKAADTKATQALANSESTQTQLDTIVIDGDSSVEAAQARVDEKGVSHSTLKARIDDGMNSVNQQLADKAKKISGLAFSQVKGTGGSISKLSRVKPTLVFIDDDTRKELYTKFYPYLQQKGIVISAAVITSRVDVDPAHITTEQLKV